MHTHNQMIRTIPTGTKIFFIHELGRSDTCGVRHAWSRWGGVFVQVRGVYGGFMNANAVGTAGECRQW